MLDVVITPQKITLEKGNEIVTAYCNNKEIKENKCYFKDNNKWIGIDNTSGDCFVEEFKELENCLDWLNGESVDTIMERKGEM